MTDRRGGVVGAAVIAVLALPVVVGIAYSFAAAVGLVGVGATGWSWRAVTAVLADGETWRGFVFSVWTAGVATVAASVCAVTLARRAGGRGGRSWYLPLAVPHVGAAIAVLWLLAPTGLVARALHAIAPSFAEAWPVLTNDGLGIGLLTAFFWKEMPFLLLVAAGAARDPALAAQAEAARTLGAMPRDVERRIVRPQLFRAIAPAAVGSAAYLLGQYEMAAILAPTHPVALPLLTVERWTDPDLARRAEAHMLGLLAMTLAVLGAIVAVRLRRPIAT